MQFRYGTGLTNCNGTSSTEVWKYVDSYNHGHDSYHKHSYIWYVSDFDQSCCRLGNIGGYGSVDTCSMCSGDYSTMGTGKCSSKGDEHACFDRQQQVFVHMGR